MSLKLLHCVRKVKQLNCDAAGTTSTFLRFLGTFGGGVNSGLNGSSGVGRGLDGFGIGIAVGNWVVKSGNTIIGAFVGNSGGGFVGSETGTVDGVTIGAGVDGVTTGGAGFVGKLFTEIVVVPFELGGVNSGSVGFFVVDDTGNVVVGTTIVLHCCATKLSGNVSQFSQTKHWSWAEAVNKKLI